MSRAHPLRGVVYRAHRDLDPIFAEIADGGEAAVRRYGGEGIFGVGAVPAVLADVGRAMDQTRPARVAAILRAARSAGAAGRDGDA